MTEGNEPGIQPGEGFGPPSGYGPSGFPPPPPGYGPPGYPPPPPGYGSPGYLPPPPGYGTPPGYWQSWQAAAAPGGIPLRPLALGDIYSGVMTSIRKNPGATLGLAAILMSISAVLSAGLNLVVRAAAPAGSFTFGPQYGTITPAQGRADAVHFLTVVLPLLVVTLGLTFIVYNVLAGMLTAVIGRSVLGRKVRLGEAWALARIGQVLAAALLLVGIAVALVLPVAILTVVLAVLHLGPAAVAVGVLGFLAVIVIEIIVMVRLSLTIPAAVLEGLSPRTAIRRSWQLSRGSAWRLFGILLLTAVVVAICTAVLQIPFSIASGITVFTATHAAGLTASTVIATVVGAIGSIVAGSVARPFSAGVTVLLYVDLRMRREGFDLALRNAAGSQLTGDEFAALWQPQAPASWPPPPSQPGPWPSAGPWPQPGGPAAP